MSNRVEVSRRGMMLVLSSPSGAGKTTLSRRLLDDEPDLAMSVSVTTRPPRPGERPGEDYIFVDTEEFGLMRNRDEFLEHAKVFDYYYGTPKKAVNEALAGGKDVLFDIDWQGTQQLIHHARQDLVSIFILPPSTRELEKRLKTRAQDSPEVVARRMEKAPDEMSHWPEYDYVVINDDLDAVYAEVKGILYTERLRRDRRKGLPDFVAQLRAGL